MTPAKVDVNHSITDSLVTQPVTHSNEDEFMQRLVGRSALDLLTEGLSPAQLLVVTNHTADSCESSPHNEWKGILINPFLSSIKFYKFSHVNQYKYQGNGSKRTICPMG